MCRHVIVLIVALLAAPAATARAAWPPGPEAGFTADVYPSAVDAARGLAPQLERLVRGAVGDGVPRTIHVAGDTSGNTDPAVVEALAEAMRRSFGDGAGVVTRPPPRPLPDGAVHVRPSVRRDAMHNAPGTDQTFKGSVMVTVHAAAAAGGEGECAAPFVEKPWLTDFEQFKGARPGRWVVGQADDPSATPDAARRDAIARAATEIVPLLAAQVGGGSGAVDGEFLARRVSAALTSGRFVADRFACRFERPYGNVYHEAILVDASPANLKAIAAEASAQRKQTVRSTLGTAGSIGGLVATIAVIYLLTNWMTKGYFAGRLRAAAVLALVAGTVLVLVLAGLFTRSAIRMDAPVPVVVN